MNPQTTLCRITPNQPHHIVASYRDGHLTCFLDGRPVHESTSVRGDFTNWSPHHILFGDEWIGDGTRTWSGRIAAVALHARAITADEAGKRYGMLSGESARP